MSKRPSVGVGVIIVKNNKILFGKRLNAHGEGTWSIPGGHLEFGESLEECTEREVAEETSIKIKNIRFMTCTNDIFETEKKHYITIFMQADWASGNPKVLEPEKMINWQWFSIDEWPKPLFLPIRNLLKTDVVIQDKKS